MVTYLHKELALKAEITNDHFVRTTDREHKEAVEYAWVRDLEMHCEKSCS
jgi:methionyl-tRNA synthetase